jgi:hypothetical protein
VAPTATPAPKVSDPVNPEVSVADAIELAEASGAADAKLGELRLLLDNMERRISGLADDVERLRGRVLALEHGAKPTPKDASVEPVIANPTPAHASPESTPANPGSHNPGPDGKQGDMDVPGLAKGTILLVEKGQSKEDFIKEYRLTPEQFAVWERNQKEQSNRRGNLTDNSWK